MTVRLKQCYEMETRLFVFFHLLAKAPGGWRTPRRFALFRNHRVAHSVLDCGGPPPLFHLPSSGQATSNPIRSPTLPKTLFAASKCVISPRDMPTHRGSIRLFRLFGIQVYLHWSWFLVAVYAIQSRGDSDSSLILNVLVYLTLFLIVLMHEFGHSLACKQVGGQANQIVLWPLGGVAYVSPPQRPGAMLWSIAAGPLVNVVLFFVATILLMLGGALGLFDRMPLFWGYIGTVAYINLILLKFNLLPVYPLDGGQILRSLLWFKFGKARSMMIATIIGFIGIAIMIPYVIKQNSGWYYILAAFVLLNCWSGFQQARALARVANAPRHDGFACPVCKVAPPRGALWVCGKCRKPFDTFETRGVCPNCGTQFSATSCPECGNLRPMSEWMAFSNVPPKL
jgi:Zn-dependent protease